MLINFTNHPSAQWGKTQYDAALCYGEIVDVHFPAVPAAADEDEIADMARYWSGKILSLHPDAVLCMGEFTLAVAVISLLHAAGIPVLATCAERQVTETHKPDGTTVKKAEFSFVRFRKYII